MESAGTHVEEANVQLAKASEYQVNNITQVLLKLLLHATQRPLETQIIYVSYLMCNRTKLISTLRNEQDKKQDTLC